jgi:hypothetical protein
MGRAGVEAVEQPRYFGSNDDIGIDDYRHLFAGTLRV